MLKPGDHVVVSRSVYGGTFRLARSVWEEFGLRFDFVDTTDRKTVHQSIRDETRMVFIETPTNPTMEITDLREVAAIAKARRILSVADNTFATPFLQQPLSFGFDIVLEQKRGRRY